MSVKIKREIREIEVLLRSIPSPALVLLAVSVIAMNLLAGKSISLPVDWLALDCGIIVSWISFLVMDVITKHFGPKAATEISFVAVAANLFACLIFFIAGHIPGMWSEAYVEGSEALICGALDRTFSGTWYVLLGSTVAFIASAAVNNFINFSVGNLFRRNPDGFASYACRTYVSTAVGQFTDNMVFALLVSHAFFGWTMLQCITCSLTGMLAELLCEAVFSPIGYSVLGKWRSEKVGKAYFELKENAA